MGMNNNSVLSITEYEEAKSYWRNKLSGNLQEVRIPVDFIKGSGYDEDNIKFALEGKMCDMLYSMSRNEDITLYTVLVAALKVLLYKYTGQSDILVGAPVCKTSRDVLRHNNYIVLRDHVDGLQTFRQFFMKVKQTIIEGYEYQHYPFDQLAELINLDDLISLGRVAAVLENIHKEKAMDETFTPIGKDITFIFYNTGSKVEGRILYNRNLFKEESIIKLKECYINILSQVLSNISMKVANVELIGEDEKERIEEAFNNTVAEYPKEKTLKKMFEEQAELTPDNIAVSCVDQWDGESLCTNLTYRQLNEKSNQLARVLREKGVKPNSIVALMTERSVEMATGILGILKAGGAYLPIDPGYPEERIMFMLKDSGTNILLTQKKFIHKVEFEGTAIDIKDEATYKGDSSNLIEINEPHDLAYVIYTSGSTGKPKGVLIEHRSVVNFANWRNKKYQYNEADVTLQLISISFDGFGTNFYSSLLSGGSLVIVGEKSWMDFGFIRSVISSSNVTNMSLVPSMYRAILEGAKSEDLETLRFVVLAGEKSGSNLIQLSKSIIPGTVLINEYGPTENTITATSFTGLSEDKTSVIGQPVQNQKIYIVNRDLNLMPVGVPGELCITGAGLSRGYFNRPELTNEKFISNPFNNVECPGSDCCLLYKTGDLARWLPDGNIEFLGRIDHQVKVRGFRIELGEIETVLSDYSPIRECAVIVGEDENESTAVFAYIVTDREVTARELREHLTKTLPDYMIPSYFVKVDKIPLSPNGKVDRNALLKHKGNISTGVEHLAPRNSQEEKLLKIWHKVLGGGAIGINDRFFDIGGDSMKAVSISEECAKQVLKISVNQIFTHKTISEIVKNLKSFEDKIDQAAEGQTGYSTTTSSINEKRHNDFAVKKLKMKPQREVTTYLHRSLPLCAILSHDHYYPWFYQHYIQVFSITYQNGFSRLEFLEPKSNFEDIFEEMYLTYEGIEDGRDIVGFIKNKIDSGFYVSIYVDEYYLPQKGSYKKHHFVHPSLLYGYDENNKRFLAVGFDSEMIFGAIAFDYDVFKEAYEGARLNYKQSAPWAETEAVQLLRPKEILRPCEFDIKRFLEELYNYMNSSGTDSSRIEKLIPLDEMNMCSDFKYGLSVHDVIFHSLKKLGDDIMRGLDVQNIIEQCMEKNVADIMPTMDYRSMHLMYEHKKCLHDRFIFITKAFGTSDNLQVLLGEYLKLIEKLNTARLIFFDLEHMFKTGFSSEATDMQQIMDSFKQMVEIMAVIKDEEAVLLGEIYKEIEGLCVFAK